MVQNSTRRRLILALVIVGAVTLIPAGSASAQEACGGTVQVGDPCGDVTGTGTDVFPDGAPASTADLDEGGLTSIIDQLGKNKIAINMTWLLFAGFLVLFMQAGFASVETGFTRAKNAAHTVTMNFVVFAVGVIGYWLVGFALQFGGVGAVAALGGTPPLTSKLCVGDWCLFGTKGFLLAGVYDVGVMGFFLFQLVFMDTAATIVTGSMAERWAWKPFLVFTLFMSMILYPVFGMWAWGGGFLATLGINLDLGHGYVDFAGSGVVHAIGGLAALAGCIILGPRIGRFNADGSANPMPGHNLPLGIIGVFILLFGWFGFNAGSTFAATDLRISVVAVNTVLAAAFGAVTCMLWVGRMSRGGKPDPSMIGNGALAGLVAVTAPSGFVAPWAACLIGAIGGILVVEASRLLERRGIDDPVGAIPVHGVNGLWGVIAVGLFADGTYGAGWNGVEGTVKGLFYGDASQLTAQLIGVAVLLLWGFGVSYLFFKVQNAISPIRVTEAEELEGLDLPLMGSRAYPDFVMAEAEEVPPVVVATANGGNSAAVLSGSTETTS